MAESHPDYCEVALPVPLDQLFTYSVPPGMAVEAGVRVVVGFGRRKMVGVVIRTGVAVHDLTPKQIKQIQAVVDEAPALTDEFLRLAKWVAEYYLVPLGGVLPAMLPKRASLRRKVRVVLTEAGERALQEADPERLIPTPEQLLLQRIAKRKGLRKQTLRDAREMLERLRRKGWVAMESTLDAGDSKDSESSNLAKLAKEIVHAAPAVSQHKLTRWQQVALDRIRTRMDSGEFGVLLLHGVTGSGKTEVYMRAIETALARGQNALMLVPEINLTPQMAGLFAGRFGSRVAVLHSGLGEKEREQQWLRVRGGGADVVIGTRSAVFAPLASPGLVIVDEEHDASYKQEEAPRYHGRDVAIVRAKEAGATVVLGSATPAVETRHHAEAGKYELLELQQRVEDRPLPRTEVVDMRQEFSETGRQTFLSRRLTEEIEKRLERREQSLILLNRRGYSAFVLCRSCGKTIECTDCSIALTHHKRRAQLLCHYCGYTRGVPEACPECESEYLYFMGEGSEKVEDALGRRFPEARIGRLDRDTASGRGKAETILAAFRSHELDVLVGTQMIAKGHDIHNVTLVGVVSADMGLARPDFRAAERSFQLITQVAGRAGRGERAGEVIIQTYFPEHYAIRAAAAQDYGQFYKQEARFRQLMHYPPFAALANVMVKSESVEAVLKLTGKLGRYLEGLQEGKQGAGWRMLGPAAAPIPKLKKSYRYHFLLKAGRRSTLRRVLRGCLEFARREKFPAGSLIIDVDPQSLF